jgi:hypothetical protein
MLGECFNMQNVPLHAKYAEGTLSADNAADVFRPIAGAD